MQKPEDFERDIRRVQTWAIAGIVAALVFWFSVIGFFVWAAVRVMAHFGVI